MTKAMHRIQRKNKFLPYLLILPSMLLFSMFTFYPFLKTIALSFFLTDKRGNPTKWAGISNWVRVLSKETFWKQRISLLDDLIPLQTVKANMMIAGTVIGFERFNVYGL